MFTLSFSFFSRMRYVAAYLLCALGGNDSPSAADIEKILGSVGVDAEADQIKKSSVS